METSRTTGATGAVRDELTPAQLAEREGISKAKVYKMLRQGCPFRRLGPRGNILVDYGAYFEWTVEQARLSEQDVVRPRNGVQAWVQNAMASLTEA